MITKVVISAAGQGTRMQELTKKRSKHLIEVDRKPFLFYVLDNLKKAGYNDITLVVGFESALIKKFLDDHNFKVKIINQIEILGPKEKIYGTACPLMCIKNINEQFLYLSGDNYYSVEDLKAVNIEDEFNYVSGIESNSPENFGVLVPFDFAQGGSDGEFLKEIVEKPIWLGSGQAQDFVGKLINASLYKFTPEIFEKLSKIEKSSRGEYEITDAVTLLAKDKKVKIKKMNGFWMDFGTPEDIEKLSNFLNGNSKKE